MIWQIVNALPGHIPHIAANMRQADQKEVMASHGHSPELALQSSLNHSVLAWTCLVRNKPAFMWGVCPLRAVLGLEGSPWLLGTDDVLEVRRDFLKFSPRYISKMQSVFPKLWNYVHADNKISQRWLKWCGFKMANAAETYGINNELFYRFWRE